MASRVWQVLDRGLAVALFIFGIGIWSFFGRQPAATAASHQLAVSPTNEERVLAIKTAQAKGDKAYTFTTNFIPGIGVITNPEQYKQNLFSQFQNLPLPK